MSPVEKPNPFWPVADRPIPAVTIVVVAALLLAIAATGLAGVAYVLARLPA